MINANPHGVEDPAFAAIAEKSLKIAKKLDAKNKSPKNKTKN